MPTFVHISDLHFGPRFVPHLGEVILHEIAALNPDAVVISGDFTLRGRHSEYAQARDFVRKIAHPTITIPGNHDQPLFAPLERLISPYKRYQSYICPTVDATLAANSLFIVGLSDCRPILPGGFWSRWQREWIREQLDCAPQGSTKIIVSHHQFLWDGEWRPAGFWYPTRTLGWLAQQGVELVLNGHTHVPTATLTPLGIVVARAGTATSVRTRRGWGNTYNVVSIGEREIEISVRKYELESKAYLQTKSFTFPRQVGLRQNKGQ